MLSSQEKRIAAARILTTLLCSISVTCLWIDKPDLAGPFTFLSLTFRELAFPPSPSIGTHIETTVVNAIAITLAVAYSCVGKVVAAYATRHHGYGPASRAIPAIFLVFMGLLAGFLRSVSPRLMVPARMAAITSVFLLTTNIGVSDVPRAVWTDFLVVTAIAAGSSLIGVLTFVHHSTRTYPRLVVASLATLRAHILESVEDAFPSPDAEKPSADTGWKYKKHLTTPLRIPYKVPKLVPTAELHRSFAQAFLEMHYTRMHVKELRSFIHILDRLRTELSWGALIPDHLHNSSQPSSYSAIREPCMMLASALSNSIALLEDTFTYAYDIKDWPPRPPATPGILADDGKVDPNFLVSAYSPAQSELANTVRLLKLQIGTIHASLDRRHSKSQGSTLFDGSDLYDDPNSMDEASKEVFSISVFTVSLLQLAADLNTALRVGKRIATKLATVRRRRLWFPKLSREWFRSHPTVAAYDRGDFDLEQFEEDDPKRSTEVEQVEGIAEEEEDLDDTTPPVSALPISLSQGSSAGQLSAHSSADLPQQKSITLLERFRRLRQSSYRRVRRIWASLIMPRRTLSKAIYRVKHSRHLQYAIKNAFGIAMLSLPAFLPLDQGGSWFQSIHGQWAVITYIYVLETNTGATIRTGGLRFVGTIFGALYAYLSFLIAHQSPYAIPALVTLFELPVSWLILRTSVAPIGVVASITVPPVIFTNLHRIATRSTILIAVDRGAAISVGILAAVLMNHFVYPRHSRRIFVDLVAKSLGRFTDLYLSLSRSISKHCGAEAKRDNTTPDPLTRKNVKLENEIRDVLFRMGALIDIMHLEISILPKPLKKYRQLMSTLQRAIDLMVGLRRVRDHIPWKETVADVMDYRREVISTILISLFAAEATFRSGAALPQFLPSPRHALENLIRQKELHVGHLKDKSSSSRSSSRGDSGTTSPIITRGRRKLAPNGRAGLSGEVLLCFALAENALLAEFVASLEEVLPIGRALHGVEEWLDVDLETQALPWGHSLTPVSSRHADDNGRGGSAGGIEEEDEGLEGERPYIDVVTPPSESVLGLSTPPPVSIAAAVSRARVARAGPPRFAIDSAAPTRNPSPRNGTPVGSPPRSPTPSLHHWMA